MRKIFYLFLLAITFFCGAANVALAQCNGNAPIINSFSPSTGFIGSTITITGANFDPTPANNQVFFGATKATVLTSSFGVITVTAPVGATTSLISVKNGCNLIAYSATPFNGIFCPTPITATTYNATAFQVSGIVGAYNMLSQDLDGDGKPEVVSAYSGLTVARNTSTPGSLSFVAQNFGMATGYNSSVSAADFDGDGKRDLFTTYNIYRNTSTGPGNINFAITASGASGYQGNVGDFNNDGKIDFVVGNGNTLQFYRNTSTGIGVISFALAFSVNVDGNCTGIQCADVDGDGKTDLLASQGNNNRSVSLRNTTTTGATAFTFETYEAWPSNGNYPYRCQIADFDKDGKIDLTTCNFNSPANVAIYRNTSTVGNISFATSVNLTSPDGNYRIQVGDVNGDGYPDIVTKSTNAAIFSVYRNTSSVPGTITFGTRFDYNSAAAAEVSGIVIGDLDGDFVPDIATSGSSSNAIRFHRNTSSQVDNTPPTAACKNIIVALSPAGTVTVTAAMIDNGSSDACGIGSILINDLASVNFTCANIGDNTVTLKVTDRAGNVTTCTATVTVAPAAIIVAGQTTVCQGQTVLLNANLGDSYQWQNNGVDIPGATNQTYTATVSGNYTVTVTNAGGCSGTSAATVITVNNNPTVNTFPAGTASLCPPGGTVTISASTSSIYQWKLNGVNISGATQQNYTTNAVGTYSVQVIDLFGCSATSAPIVVNATDNIAPTAICKPKTVVVNAGGPVVITAADINNGSFDNCSVASVAITAGQTSFTCADAGRTFNVTLTVTDGSGNTSSCTAVVTVTDPNLVCNQPPVAICRALTLSASANCTATAVAADFDGGSTDADAGDVLTYSVFPAGPYALGVTNVTLTVTDSKGASSSCTTTVTVRDVTPPVLVGVPADVTVECDAVPAAAVVTATDNCDASPVVTFTEVRTNGFSPNDYTLTRTWTATDASNNSLTSIQVITVRDMRPPVLVGVPADITVQCNAVPDPAAVSATDICDASPVIQLSFTIIPGNCPGNYSIQRTWTATDASGNRTSAVQVVTVIDNTAPVFSGTALAAIAASCDAVPAAQVFTATDNCDQAPVVTYTEVRTNGTSPNDYTLTRTWTATDACGNATTQQQIVTVSDTQVPVLVGVPSNATVECDAVPAAAVVTATDNCDASPVVTFTEVRTNGISQNDYVLTRTWTVTDASGNVSSASQVITVKDTKAPVLVGVPSNVTVECDAVPAAAVVTATDNCDASPVVTYTEVRTDGLTPNDYILTRTWTVTDASGNASSGSQVVTVKDTKAPILTTPSNVSVSNATGICGAPVSYVATATDNCSPVAITYSVASGFVFPVGSTSVTVTATDLSGNSTSGSFTVTIIDTEAPKAICKPVTVTLVNGAASITAADVNNGSTDNCGIASVVISKSTFSCANIGANTVTLTVTDIYNNVSTCTAVVTVVGEIPSCTITSIRSSSVYTGAPATSLFLGYGAQSTTLKVTPAANGAPYTYSWTGTGVNMLSSTTSGSPVFTPTVAGNYTFTVQTTNVYGCTTTCSITICVTDVRVYSYNDKHRKDHDDDHHDGKCDDDDDDDRRGGNNHDGDDDDDDHGDRNGNRHHGDDDDDDDDRKVYICHVPNGNHGNPQTLSISVYAVASHLRNHPLDKLGSCDQQPCSAYTDRIKPLVYCPKDITVSCTGSILPSATGTATGRDNYSAVTITYSDVTVGNKITRTWKVTDAAGNFSTCKQTITVGVYFSASITSVPTSNTNTGGVSTNLYLGYGAQSTALKVGSLPSSGAPYTYSWTGTNLSNTSSSAPVFTPTVHGVSSFTVTITNKYGCSVTSSISICVTDIRVPGSNGTKVYVCHTTKGKNPVSTTSQVLVSQVSSHIGNSCGSNGNDRLGSCGQQPCTPPSVNAIGTNTSSFTKETGSVSEVTEDLKVTVMPNPSSSHFTIKLESRYQTPVELRVLDGRGRVVDARSKMGSNSTIQIGHNYSSGTYYAEMIQGTTRKVVQLIKLK